MRSKEPRKASTKFFSFSGVFCTGIYPQISGMVMYAMAENLVFLGYFNFTQNCEE
jgi:hypothetical protein